MGHVVQSMGPLVRELPTAFVREGPSTWHFSFGDVAVPNCGCVSRPRRDAARGLSWRSCRLVVTSAAAKASVVVTPACADGLLLWKMALPLAASPEAAWP